MADYAIQVTSKTTPGETGQAIVGTPEWAEANLGGEWVALPDPYTPNPDDPRVYAGPGMKFDPGVPEQFTGDIWDASKATTMQSDGDGGFFWFYNTQGQLTWHQGRVWRNLLPDGTPNTNEPGVANWREYPLENGVPVWLQPTGAFDAYPVGFIVKHNGGRYQSVIPANTTTPGTDERWWTELDPPVVVGPEPWQPWTSGLNGDLYQIGDRVTHNGQTWEATFGNNYWEPGVFGWVAL